MTSTRCTITLSNPDPDSLSLLRLFVGSVARVWNLVESDRADLRVAAYELATASLAATSGEVSMSLEMSDRTIELAVWPLSPQDLDEGPEPARDVVEALFDRVAVSGRRAVVTLDAVL